MCKTCGAKLQKWGKDARGNTRFRCKNCKTSTLRKRPDLSQKYRLRLFQKWLLGKLSLEEIAADYQVTRQTLHTWFTPFWDIEPQPKLINISGQVLILDGKFVEMNATVLIATTTNGVVSWHFTQRENHASWLAFADTLRHFPFAVVCDGQKGLLKAINQRFPGVIIQRCQFHVIQYVTIKLTRNPESIAARKFRQLVLQIVKVKSKSDLRVWLDAYKHWHKTYQEFLKEKTYQDNNLTPTGRKRWHYTHGRLHAASSHLKNALPNLFMYLFHPQIPNTSNYIEGAVNAQLQEKLRFHRGLSLLKRRVLIATFLASKQCGKTNEKPTQNVH